MTDFYIKQGDTAPAWDDTLKDNDGNPINLTGAGVRFHMAPQDFTEAKVDAAAVIVDAANGKVRYNWQTADTDEAGDFYAEWEVTHASGQIETFPNDGYRHVTIGRELA